MSVHTIARFGTCALVLGLLSACATAPTTISAQSESTQYRGRAARNYTPPGPASDPWGPYIVEASAKYDVPERWIREVMRQESGGRLYGRGGDLVTSGAGAMGLMQVMPGTYDELRGRYPELGTDAYDPRNNILAGTAYVREMYDIYGSPGFLAAYNAGPGRLDDYLTRNRTLPEETRRYVASIGPRLVGEPQRASPGAQYAMNNLPAAIPSGSRYAAGSRYVAPAYVAPASAPVITLSPVQTAPIALARVSTPAPAVRMAQNDAPRGNFITLNPPAAEATVMPVADTAPDGPSPYIRLQPEAPAQYAQAYVPAEPVRAPAYAPLPVPVAAPAFTPAFAQAYAPVPPVPVPVPPGRGYAQFAQIPQPPALPLSPAPAPRSQSQMAAAALVPVAPHGSPFGLVSQANAEPIGLRRSGFAPSGTWGVQVGAFANEGLASSASFAARDHVRDLLGTARPSITPVRQSGGTLYRARLIGVSRDAASQACERLARARTTCMMVSPDAQS